MVDCLTKYETENCIIALHMGKHLKCIIETDLIEAFESSQFLIVDHSQLFNNSTSFFDFLCKVLKLQYSNVSLKRPLQKNQQKNVDVFKKSKITDLNKQIDTLKEDMLLNMGIMENKQQKNVENIKLLSKLRNEINILKNEKSKIILNGETVLNDLYKQIDALRKELLVKTSIIESLKENSVTKYLQKDTSIAYQQLYERFIRVKGSLERTELKFNTLQEKDKDLQRQIKNLKEELSDCYNRLTVDYTKTELLTEQLREATAIKQTFQNYKNEDEWKEMKCAKDNEISRLNLKIEILEKEVERLKSTSSSFEFSETLKLTTSLQAKIQTLQDQLKVKDETLNLCNTEKQNLNVLNQDLTDQLDIVKQQLNESKFLSYESNEDYLETIELKFKEKKIKIDQLQKAIIVTESKLSEYAKKNEELIREIKNLRQRVKKEPENKKMEDKKYIRRIAELEEQIKTLQEIPEETSWKEKCKELKIEKNKIVREKQELIEENKKMETDLEETSYQLTDLTRKYKHCEEKLNEQSLNIPDIINPNEELKTLFLQFLIYHFDMYYRYLQESSLPFIDWDEEWLKLKTCIDSLSKSNDMEKVLIAYVEGQMHILSGRKLLSLGNVEIENDSIHYYMSLATEHIQKFYEKSTASVFKKYQLDYSLETLHNMLKNFNALKMLLGNSDSINKRITMLIEIIRDEYNQSDLPLLKWLKNKLQQ